MLASLDRGQDDYLSQRPSTWCKTGHGLVAQPGLLMYTINSAMYTGLGPLGAGIAARSEAPASLAAAVEDFADQPSWPLHSGGVPGCCAGQY